jgi:hypothetical protein
MAQISLIKYPDDQQGNNAFVWEHAMSHRSYMGAMAPLTGFSRVPYLLDPEYRTEIPASDWHMSHQQAHWDALNGVSSWFNIAPVLPTPTAAGSGIGIPSHQNLVDTDLQSQGQQQWWTFANHMEHYALTNGINLLTELTFPFW